MPPTDCRHWRRPARHASVGPAALSAAHTAVQWVRRPSACPTYFNRRHPVAACLQQHANAGGGDALAQPAHHTTCSVRASQVGSHDASRQKGATCSAPQSAAGGPGAPALRTCDQNILHPANQCLLQARAAPPQAPPLLPLFKLSAAKLGDVHRARYCNRRCTQRCGNAVRHQKRRACQHFPAVF